MIQQGARELFCVVHDRNVDSLLRRCSGLAAAIDNQNSNGGNIYNGGMIFVPADRKAEQIRIVEDEVERQSLAATVDPYWGGVGLLGVGQQTVNGLVLLKQVRLLPDLELDDVTDVKWLTLGTPKRDRSNI